MSADTLIANLKAHPQYPRVGMILLHNGVVRATSRDGRPVSALEVRVDHARLAEVLRSHRALPGIIDIQVMIHEGRRLQVGEDVMLLAVAGDVRERVIEALSRTLDAIKTTVTAKTEFDAHGQSL
jgi:molybdopterin synthase catalytic subunit